MFNESNTVEAYVRDLLAGQIKAVPVNTLQEPSASYGASPKGIGWRYAAPAQVPRQIQEVLVESWLRDALIRLNPEIAAQPDRADEVLYTSWCLTFPMSMPTRRYAGEFLYATLGQHAVHLEHRHTTKRGLLAKFPAMPQVSKWRHLSANVDR